MNAAELLEAALALPEAERAELAELLAESVHTEAGRLHPGWESELRRRVEELDAGAVRGVPLAEAVQSVRTQLAAGAPANG
jgi:putative addiction module component (TIGR02574 family)